MASDPDQGYVYFIGSETLTFTCYILSDESSVPSYSARSGSKKYEVCSIISD